MAGLMDLFIKIGVKDEASGPIKKISGAVGKGLATAAKLGGAAIGATATGLGILGKQALSAYADYEQLVGGIETLFEDLSVDIQENAAQAYKTAGLSANEYMETAMSFAASLNQSLKRTDGNIARSAELTDMAIRDMSDNANKMGTSMEAIQTAYQGFAKQNYTMLDNLKLGYGGTKTEMERLLADAQELSGVEYNIENLSDVYEAIHAIQTEMGISGITIEEANELIASGAMSAEEAYALLGTTAKEASTTISGSFNQLKGAWANFLAGLGNSDADLSGLIDNLVQSASTVLQNIKPVALQIVTGLATAIQAAAPIIADVLPQIAVELIPPLISAAATLVGALVKALPGILSAVWDGIKAVGKQLLPVLESVFGGVAGWFSEKFQAARAAVQAAFQSIGDFFSGVWADIVGVFEDAKNVGVNVVNDILTGIQSVWDSIVSWVSGAWDKVKSFFTIDVSFLGGGKSHAIGNDYVPYNNYPAILHRGEAVLTAREADEWRRGKGSGGNGVTNVFNFHGVSQSDLDYIVAYVNRGLA